ncbi:MAG: aminotransferase class V-fold PLP-dependent enzyme [Lachnospiraceae bacterium]|nr:aminotransferase class V-fold PLP-dependent enzyme [Lachnospiraceae bacterium]
MLIDKLREYSKEDVYPFHMPGHKRINYGMPDAIGIDITEIDGFDDLHNARGIIEGEQERLAEVYDSKQSYILVNGSSCGNIAAIFDACKVNEKIIVGRNCHKSVYYGCILRRLQVVYTMPEVSHQGIVTGTKIEEIARVIEENPDARAIVVTSPTYEGYVEPLEEIVRLAHDNKMKVIVDAAHGAHLGFDKYFPENPVKSGADYVIMSMHKTMPAMTQTAVIHVNTWDRKIDTYLRMFQTSSPSYVLMASISQGMNYLEENPDLFENYGNLLRDFYEKTKGLKIFDILQDKNRDPSKIVIICKGGLSGKDLEEILREDYRIQVEMSSFNYVIAMTSPMDTPEGLDRLAQALEDMDLTYGDIENDYDTIAFEDVFTSDKKLEIYEPLDSERELINIFKSGENRISAGMVSLYPPGIPICVQGERITAEQINLIKEALEAGLTVTGLEEKTLVEVVI